MAAAEPVGAYLSRQRRLRKIELEELAALTRIPTRSLERLESGAFDSAPDGFARGFVRTVAAAIGLDPDETVARMLAEPETGPRRLWPRRERLVLVLAVLLGVSALVGSGYAAWRSRPGLTAAPRSPLPVRRDAVRALAEERGLLTASPERPAPPLEPAIEGP
jgi:cytoskeleton protein RodZ